MARWMPDGNRLNQPQSPLSPYIRTRQPHREIVYNSVDVVWPPLMPKEKAGLNFSELPSPGSRSVMAATSSGCPSQKKRPPNQIERDQSPKTGTIRRTMNRTFQCCSCHMPITDEWTECVSGKGDAIWYGVSRCCPRTRSGGGRQGNFPYASPVSARHLECSSSEGLCGASPVQLAAIVCVKFSYHYPFVCCLSFAFVNRFRLLLLRSVSPETKDCRC